MHQQYINPQIEMPRRCYADDPPIGNLLGLLKEEEYVRFRNDGSASIDTVILNHPEAYVYSAIFYRKYNWNLDVKCQKTGKVDRFISSGEFKRETSNTAAVFYIASGLNDTVSVSQLEYADSVSNDLELLP